MYTSTVDLKGLNEPSIIRLNILCNHSKTYIVLNELNYKSTFVSLQIAAGSLTVIGLFGSSSEVGNLTGTLLLL